MQIYPSTDFVEDTCISLQNMCVYEFFVLILLFEKKNYLVSDMSKDRKSATKWQIVFVCLLEGNHIYKCDVVWLAFIEYFGNSYQNYPRTKHHVFMVLLACI